MKILCQFGYQIVDGTDSLPHKAHVVSDQVWFDLLDEIDVVIEGSRNSKADREKACMRVREILGRKARPAWQCSGCGTLHMDDGTGVTRRFRPDGEDSARSLFAER